MIASSRLVVQVVVVIASSRVNGGGRSSRGVIASLTLVVGCPRGVVIASSMAVVVGR